MKKLGKAWSWNAAETDGTHPKYGRYTAERHWWSLDAGKVVRKNKVVQS